MNFCPNLGQVAGAPKPPADASLDLNPYLNFLLDLNTLNLTSSPQAQSVPAVLNPQKSVQTSQSLISNVIPKTAAENSRATSALSTSEITSRLDRLEVQLSKIVNNVVRDCEKRRNLDLPRRCLSPVTTDDEEEGGCSAYGKRNGGEYESRYFPSKSRAREGCGDRREYRLLPPASFEDEEPELLPARVRSRTTKKEDKTRQSGSKQAFQNDLKVEQERRSDLEAKLTASQEELKRLKVQSDSSRTEVVEAQAKQQKIQMTLAEESERREKLERSLDIHKKLSANLNVKLQACEQREQELQSTLTLKEAALTTLNCLQRENQTLKDEIRRLNTIVTTSRQKGQQEDTKEKSRESVEEAMKTATTKFAKFHKDEIRRVESQLRTSEEVIKELEEQLEAAANEKEREVTKLKSSCSKIELDVVASKSREEIQERRAADLAEDIKRAKESARLKDEEVEVLQKTINCLRKECERVKNNMASMHSEKSSLRDLRDAVEESSKKLAKTEQDKAQLYERAMKAEEERNSLREKMAEINETVRTLKERQAVELRSRDENCEKMRSDLLLQESSVKARNQTIEDLQETIQKLKRSVDSGPRPPTTSADTEHFKRRNRELEEVLERLEDRKEELKCQLAASEAQYQESCQAHQIINAKWKEKTAYIARLQANHATLQARFEMREEELKLGRDEALERVQALETKVEELTTRSRQLRQADVQTLKNKYEQQLSKKDACSLKIEQQNRELEDRLRELTEELTSQKKQITGKFTRLGRFLQDFENDL